MKCPNLTGDYCEMSAIGRVPYFPSEFQLFEYCTKSFHKRCPFYLGYHSRMHCGPSGCAG